MMSHHEMMVARDEMSRIKRSLRCFQFDQQYLPVRGGPPQPGYRAASLAGIARLANCSRQNLFALMGDRLPFKPSIKLRRRLLWVIDQVERLGLRWVVREKGELATPTLPDGTEVVLPRALRPTRKSPRKYAKRGTGRQSRASREHINA